MALKFKVISDIDYENGGRSIASVYLDYGPDWVPVFGPIDVTDLRGRDYEEDVHIRVGIAFGAALRAALANTS